MPKLIARERFYYAGRNVEAEEEFEAQAQDVALLTNSVSPRARLPETIAAPAHGGLFEHKAAPAVDEQAVDGDDERPPRGRYKRRDMRAKE